MEIVFDNIIYSKEKQGGISNYWFELTKNFSKNKQVFFYEEKTALDNIFRKQLNFENIISHNHFPVSLARLLPIRYQTNSTYLLYHSSFYRKLITNAKVCEITTVHDFLHQRHSASLLKKKLHNTLKFGSIRRANGIICVSNNTLKDMKKYCPPEAVQKIAVIYNGVSNIYRPIDKDNEHQNLFSFNLNDKFILFVGARSKYKNFDFVTELLTQLPHYKLVVVGNLLTKVEKLKIPQDLHNRIIVANSISNKQLNVLYNYAQALLYPSSYEGFGFPMVEAMKAGCPVLALNVTSIPEVAGAAAILFDNLSISAFTKTITDLDNTNKRMEIVSAGFENAKRFDWTKCLRETTEFYDEVYNNYQ